MKDYIHFRILWKFSINNQPIIKYIKTFLIYVKKALPYPRVGVLESGNEMVAKGMVYKDLEGWGGY